MNNDIKIINLASIIYGMYTKTEVLEKLVYDTYSNSSIQNATNLNIYVDLNSAMHALYSEHNRIVYNNITDLSSGLINMCAHYRHYFRSLSVNTRFFLINSLNTCDINRKLVPEYNNTFFAKTQITKTNKLIDNNMALLKILCPYLPGIYYIDSVQQFETSVIIAHLIETLNDGNPNLIISRDIYPFQLTALYPYTSYLRPKKDNMHKLDKSYMFPINEKPNYREEFWNAVSKERNINKERNSTDLSKISPLNFALFCALSKLPERSLLPLSAIPAALKTVYNMVGSEDIKINYNQIMTDPNITDKYPYGLVDARYKAIDVQYMLPYYRNTPEAKNIQLLDLEDAPAVNRISSKYYINNPLDLLRL